MGIGALVILRQYLSGAHGLLYAHGLLRMKTYWGSMPYAYGGDLILRPAG